MRTIWAAAMMAALVTGEAHAADWRAQTYDTRQGAFIGARMTIALGSQTRSNPVAELALAPSTTRIANSGRISTSIGSGVALRIAGDKPVLMLGGTRADRTLGFNRSGQVDAKQKLGITSAGWIGIGVATIAIAAGVFYLYAEHVAAHDEDDPR